MRKRAFCICENKDTDQLCCNCAADQCLCLSYIDTTMHLLSKSEIQVSSHLLWLYSLFVSDLAGDPEDWFSHNEANFVYIHGIIVELYQSGYLSLRTNCTDNISAAM